MIEQLNLHVTAQGVVEVDNATYLDLCCEVGNIQGKRQLPSHDVHYVGSREIDRKVMRAAVADYLNRLLVEGWLG